MKKVWYFLPLLVIVVLVACTSNPMSDNEVELDQTTVTGQVEIADGGSPQNVFVWLKGFDVGTWTDANGRFSLVLPAEQTGGSGTVQKDTIYFYLSNYFLETAVVSILEGQFLFLRDDVDADGNVRGPIVMQKFVTISTAVNNLGDGDSVRVRVTLEADSTCAQVINPFIVRHDRRLDPAIDTLGAVLIKPVNSDNVTIFRSDQEAAGFETLVPCRNAPVERELILFPNELSLQSGEYEIIPYLRVEPANVPLALLAKIGADVDQLSRNYLKKPIRREGGRFVFQN